MSMKSFKGTMPALITPFDHEGNVDASRFRRFLDWLVPQVSGLYVGGSYGSGPIMTVDQRRQTIEIVAENVDGRIPVVLHAGDPDTYTTIELARHAESVGVSAVASLTPYYYLHGPDEVDAHFLRLIDAVSTPVFLYNNPKYTNYCVTAEQVARLAEQGLAGIKDSSANIQLFYALVAATSGIEDFQVLVGSQTILLPALVGGGRGCISGLSNLYPKVVNGIFAAAVEGDFDRALALQREANELRKLTGAGIPVPFYHTALRYRGIDIGVPKRPLLPKSEEEEAAIFKALDGYRHFE
ncbi:MAG: dihydrodipicolinate synthase family protein [Gammaproteobacteria bacterium]|nr:dihydrodipicolinate synthase family protein [Gammaproteobacteria bacterium]